MFEYNNNLKSNIRWRGESGAGFTIIEVLIVIAIIMLFSIVLISNFPEFKLQSSLSRTAYKFGQDLRKVQADAFSSAPYVDANGVSQPIEGYGIYVGLDDPGQKKYIVYADKMPGNQRYDTEDYLVATVDIALDEPGIVIQNILNSVGNSVSINFTPPNPLTKISNSLGGETSRVDIIFAQENDISKNKTVSIYSSGLIEVK